MNDHMPPLSALRAFEAAARHMSFSKAADELFVTPAAISHQIHTLEQDLGIRLFSPAEPVGGIDGVGARLVAGAVGGLCRAARLDQAAARA